MVALGRGASTRGMAGGSGIPELLHNDRDVVSSSVLLCDDDDVAHLFELAQSHGGLPC